MQLSGANYAGPKNSDALTADGGDGDYDVCVATAQFGSGRILFLGDVNCECATSSLVHAFCAALPPSSFGSLAEDELREVAAQRAAGNSSFLTSDFAAAIERYNAALQVFGGRLGSEAQRAEKSKLLSNKAECLLKLARWRDSARAATAALAADAGNAKARCRRARALVELGTQEDVDLASSDLRELRRAGVSDLAEKELFCD
jgi:hypothetical protein